MECLILPKKFQESKQKIALPFPIIQFIQMHYLQDSLCLWALKKVPEGTSLGNVLMNQHGDCNKLVNN